MVKNQYRLDDDKPQLFLKITILGVVIFLPKRYESLRLSAMEKAKAQLMLNASSREAAYVAAQDLMVSLRALRLTGVEDPWLIEAIKKLDAIPSLPRS
jgi:hypothetical protein